jgi:hypothetical protein
VGAVPEKGQGLGISPDGFVFCVLFSCDDGPLLPSCDQVTLAQAGQRRIVWVGFVATDDRPLAIEPSSLFGAPHRNATQTFLCPPIKRALEIEEAAGNSVDRK